MAKLYSLVVLATLAVAAHGIPRYPLYCPCDYVLDDASVAVPMASDAAVVNPDFDLYPSYPGCPCYCQQRVCPLCVQHCDCPAEASLTERIAPDAVAMPVDTVDCICAVPDCDPSECTYTNMYCRSKPYLTAYR